MSNLRLQDKPVVRGRRKVLKILALGVENNFFDKTETRHKKLNLP